MTIIEDPPIIDVPIRVEDMPPLVVADPLPPASIWPDGPPKARPVDVLEYALALLQKRGWCQNRQEDAEGRLCALGAIVATRAPDATLRKALDALEYEIPYTSVPSWNDMRGQTAERVQAVFRRAISRLR